MTNNAPKKLLDYFTRQDDPQGKFQDFSCDRCKELITGKEQFIAHTGVCDKHFCVVCKKTFHSAGSYGRHLRVNCPPRRFECSKCSVSYSRASDANAHEQKCAGKDLKKCDQCATVFLTHKELTDHLCLNTQPSTAVPIHPPPVAVSATLQTIVLLDLETTGLIRGTEYPEIIEISLIAIHTDGFLNPAVNNFPRATHKLTLCLHPKKIINDLAREITG